MNMNEFESENFSNFDSSYDSESFDMYDEYGQQVGQAKKSVAAVSQGTSLVTLQIDNQSGATQVVELFNWISSITKIANPSVSAYLPITGDNFFAANGQNKIYFNGTGDLIYNNGGSLCTLKGTDAPYRALFDMTGVGNFIITKLRYSVTTDPQFNNSITWFRKTALGIDKRNTINPRSYKAPTQFQDKVVDITQKIPIDAEHGLWIPVLSAEVVTLQLFIKKVDRSTMLSK